VKQKGPLKLALAERTHIREDRQENEQENRRTGTERFQARSNEIANNISSVVVTSQKNVNLALLSLFAQRHVPLVDLLPGVG